MRSRAPEIVVHGTVESGKTHPCLQRLYQLHCQIPNLVSFICRKQKVDMRKSVIDQWELEVLPFPVNDPRSPCRPYGGKSPSMYLWKNGGITYCFGIQEAMSLLGARFDCGFVCQAEQLTLAEWEFLSHRCGRAGNWRDSNDDPYGQIWADANPDVDLHWIPKRIEEGKLTDFKTSFKDSIIFHKDGQWTNYGIKRVKHLKETITGIRYRRLVEGEWCSAEGLVFPEFDRKVHVIDTLPDWVNDKDTVVYQGIDYGHSAPLACMWIAHNDFTNEMIVFKEWSKSNVLIEDHIAAITEHSFGLNVTLRVSDHDSQMNHQLEAAGLGTENANKEAGSILRGLDLIRIRLRNRTLKFFSGLLIEEDPILVERNAPTNIIEEMGLYRHKPLSKHVGNSAKDDIPMTGQSDHRIDSIRYIIDKVDREAPLQVPSSVANIDTNNWRMW